MNFLQKFRDFVIAPSHTRTMGLVIMLVLVSAVSLTVIASQQQQTLKQRASGEECKLDTASCETNFNQCLQKCESFKTAFQQLYTCTIYSYNDRYCQDEIAGLRKGGGTCGTQDNSSNCNDFGEENGSSKTVCFPDPTCPSNTTDDNYNNCTTACGTEKSICDNNVITQYNNCVSQQKEQVKKTAEEIAQKFQALIPPPPPPKPLQVVADFSASATEGNAPLTVWFDDQSTGDITKRQWQFHDDTTIYNETRSGYRYAQAGEYYVLLTVTGPGGTSSKVMKIVVNAPPVPPAPPGAPSAVQCTNGTDCPSRGSCQTASCANGNCTYARNSAGTKCPDPATGAFTYVCDFLGGCFPPDATMKTSETATSCPDVSLYNNLISAYQDPNYLTNNSGIKTKLNPYLIDGKVELLSFNILRQEIKNCQR